MSLHARSCMSDVLKVKLSLFMIRYHAIRTYGGVEA
jgi:hypothetical protein